MATKAEATHEGREKFESDHEERDGDGLPGWEGQDKAAWMEGIKARMQGWTEGETKRLDQCCCWYLVIYSANVLAPFA